MRLLDGVLVGIQALRWVIHQWLVLRLLLVVLERQITRHQPWE